VEGAWRVRRLDADARAWSPARPRTGKVPVPERTMTSSSPRLLVVTTGGTIASRRDPASGAATAAIDTDGLLAAVPALADVAEVEGRSFGLINSWDMTPAAMLALAHELRACLASDPPDGVVVTHGTDTLEETAFALELLVGPDRPLVLTGAMRPADSPGSDGPRNLLDAALVATDRSSRGLGVAVVMGGEVHAPRYVTKLHTTALHTFASPDWGPLGILDGERLTVRWAPRGLPALPAIPPADAELPAVALVTMVAGLGGAPVRWAADAGVVGLVLAGSGSGNVHADAAPAIDALMDAGVPVVLASRCTAGRVTPVYGGQGGGATLVERGVIPAGDLSGPKARLALTFLLAAGATVEEIRRWFAEVV
jgi:L-asparaginase